MAKKKTYGNGSYGTIAGYLEKRRDKVKGATATYKEDAPVSTSEIYDMWKKRREAETGTSRAAQRRDEGLTVSQDLVDRTAKTPTSASTQNARNRNELEKALGRAPHGIFSDYMVPMAVRAKEQAKTPREAYKPTEKVSAKAMESIRNTTPSGSLNILTPEEAVAQRSSGKFDNSDTHNMLLAIAKGLNPNNPNSLGEEIGYALRQPSDNPYQENSLQPTNDAARRIQYAAAARKDPKNPLQRALKEASRYQNDLSVPDAIRQYTAMSPMDRQRYNELYGEYGVERAENFRAALGNYTNYRIAKQNYNDNPAMHNPVSRIGSRFISGVENFGEGIENSIPMALGITAKKPTSINSYEGNILRENAANGAEQVLQDLAETTGRMAPTSLLGAGLGAKGIPYAGRIANAAFGLSVGGNAYQRTINEGYDRNKATAIGVQQTVDEAVTNWLIGGINSYGGGVLKNALGNTTMAQAARQGLMKLATTRGGAYIVDRFLNTAGNMASEGAQEYLQNFTEKLTRNIVLGEKNKIDLMDPEAWYEAGLGALNAFAINAGTDFATLSYNQVNNDRIRRQERAAYEEALNRQEPADYDLNEDSVVDVDYYEPGEAAPETDMQYGTMTFEPTVDEATPDAPTSSGNVQQQVDETVNAAVDALMEEHNIDTADTSESTPDEAKNLTQQAVEAIQEEEAAQEIADVVPETTKNTENVVQETTKETEPLIVQEQQEKPVEETSTEVSRENDKVEERVSSDTLRDELSEYNKYTDGHFEYGITQDWDANGYLRGYIKDISGEKYGGMIEDARSMKYKSEPMINYNRALEDLINVARNNGFTSDTVNSNDKLQQIAEDNINKSNALEDLKKRFKIDENKLNEYIKTRDNSILSDIINSLKRKAKREFWNENHPRMVSNDYMEDNYLENMLKKALEDNQTPAAEPTESNTKPDFDAELDRRSKARFPQDPDAQKFYNKAFEEFADKIGVHNEPMSIITSYDDNMAKAYQAGLSGSPISSLDNDKMFRNFDEHFPDLSHMMYELGYNKSTKGNAQGGNVNEETTDTVREPERRQDERGTLGRIGEVLHGGTGEGTGTGELRTGATEGDAGVHTEEGTGVRSTGDAVRPGNDNGQTDAGSIRESSRSGDAGVSGDGVSQGDQVSDNERRSDTGRTQEDTGRVQLESEVENNKAPLEPKTPEEKIDKEDEIATQEMPKGNNFVMTPDFIKSIPSTSAKRRDANIEAIKTLKNILSENRIATPDEQIILAKYTGWGGVTSGKNGDWQKAEKALKGILTEEELDTARHSLEDAYFTSPDIIQGMYNGLSSIGFTGGRILEPSAGTGRFIGSMPEKMIPSVTRMTAVELDHVSGQIARLLYPNADVRIQGFQDANILSDFNDVVIGNVPFGKMNFIDNRYPKYPRLEHYFIERSIDATRPGGVCALITAHTAIDGGRDANGYMDLEFRGRIMKKADLIGAIRLPDNAFGITGTDVVSDILVFKKRKDGDPYMGESFKSSKNFGKDGVYTNVNEYFSKHPEMILGKYEIAPTGPNGPHWTVKAKKGSLQQQIEKAFSNITQRMEYDRKSDLEAVREANREARNNKKGTGYIKDGVLYKNKDGREVKVEMSEDHLDKYKMAMEIRDTARALVDAMSEGREEKTISDLRKQLNEQYDAFYKKTYTKKDGGGFHRKYISEILAKDSDYAFLKSLERVSTKDGKTIVEKAPIFFRNTVNAPVEVTHVDTLTEGIQVSMGKEGFIRPDYIAGLMGKNAAEIEKELDNGDLAYRDADNNFVPSNIYLSGNVRAKLKEAEGLAETDKKYKKNVEALKKVVPEFVKGEDIRVHIGANWIPEEYYSEFATELMKPKYGRQKVMVHYVRGAGYNVDSTGFSHSENENINVWGTNKMPFLYENQSSPGLLWRILNNYNLEVKYTEEYVNEVGETKKRQKHDLKEEAALREIKRKLTNEFNNWLWKDETRREHLETLFNDRYNSNAEAHYDKDVTIKGQSPMITLMDHQKRLVNRAVQSPYNVIAQHGVGAGKTFASIASLMKMKELGMISKPVIVVPKNKISDWQNDFYTLFPNANVLVADSFTFKKDYRKEFVNRIATNDVDAVIISYEQFKDIPMSPEKRLEYNRKELAKIMESAQDEGAGMNEEGKFVFKNSTKTTRQLEQLKDRIKTEIAELENFKVTEDNIFFEQTGIDYICVDEAQNFKNLMYFTNLSGVADMGTQKGSQRAKDMKIKTDYVRNMQKGKGIMFLTATPIMNSPVEAYTMLRFTADEELEKMGIRTLDDFISMFGEIEDITRLDNAGRNWTTKTSFTGFCNLQQWQSLWKTFVDRVKTEDIPGIRLPKVVETTIECQAGPVARNVINGMPERLEHVSQKGENHVFAIQSDGKKASFTQRFFDDSLPYGENEKVVVAVREMFKEWQDTKTFKDWDGNIQENGVQLCFCDFGTPKGNEKEKASSEDKEDADDKVYNPNEENEKIMRGNLNIYQDMKDMLVKMGVPANEIAFIQDFKGDETKAAKLYDDVKAGRVRILFGSTKTMGEGLNIQDRITCMNMMNPFMRPGDREQAVGRGQRNHNMNPEVKVKVYVTLDTFDTKQWDNTNLKGRFINQIQDGNYQGNTANIEYSETMSAADIMAVASGNPLLKTQAETNKQIEDLNLLRESYYQKQSNIRSDLEWRTRQATQSEEYAENIRKDIKIASDISGDNFKAKVEGKNYDNREDFGKAVLRLADKALRDVYSKGEIQPRTLGSIAGFDIIADQNIKSDILILSGNNAYEVELPANKTRVTTEENYFDDSKPAGIATRFQNAVKNLPKNLERAERRASDAKVEIERLNEELRKPFEQQRKLEEYQNLAEEIEIALKENDSERFDDLNNRYKELKNSDVQFAKSKKKKGKSAAETTIKESPENPRGDFDIEKRPQKKPTTREQEQKERAKEFQESLRPDKFIAKKNIGSDAEVERVEDILGQAAYDFGFQYTPGKRYTKGKDIGGQFNRRNKGVRTKVANYLPDFSHEFGHWLADHYNISSGTIYDLTMRAEAQKAFYEEYEEGDYGEDEVFDEGIAEFVRLYLQNRDTARIDYPELSENILNKLTPRDLDLFENLADKINALYAAGAKEITQHTVKHEESLRDYREFGKKVHDAMVREQINWVDSNYGMKDFDYEYGTNTHMRATNAEYIDGTIGYAMDGQLRDLEGNYLGLSLKDCVKGVNLDPKSQEFRDFGDYLVVRHAPERLALGMRTYEDDRQNNQKWMAERQAELEKKYPHFKAAAENLDTFQKNVLKHYALKYGLITPQAYKNMLKDYPHYVPFFRTGFKEKGNALRRAHGSGRTIINPLDNIITSTMKIMNAASRNAVLLEMRKAALENDANALFLEQIPEPKMPMNFDMRGIKEALHNEIADIDVARGVDPTAQDLLHDMVDKINNTLTQFQTGRARKDLNEIAIMVDGKPEFWKVNDENLFTSLTSMDYRTANTLVNIYGKLTRFMTSNTTGNNVVWSIFSNSPRDFQTLINYSNTKNVFKLAKLIGDSYIQSLNEFRGEPTSDYYSEFLSMGAKGAPVWVGSDTYVKDMRKLVNSSKKFDPSMLNPFKYFRFLAETIEMGPRYATYRLMRERGMSPQRAFYESMDITTNFRKKGLHGKELNKAVQFFNANVQGLDHAIRYYSAEDLKGKDKKIRDKAIRARMTFLVATSLITAMLSFAWNHRDDDDKDEYNLLSNYIKNYYFTIHLGDGKFFSIPKNHELSVLESFFERSFEKLLDENDQAFKEYFDYFAEQVAPPIASEILKLPVNVKTKGTQDALEDLVNGVISNSGVFGAAVQATNNKNYLGAKIVPTAYENLAPRQQYNKKTSELAYLIGQALNISPMKLDHFAGNVLGYMWDYQKALWPINEGDVKGERDPFLGVVNKYIRDNRYSNNVSNWIYDQAEKSQERYQTYGDNILEASLDEYMKKRYNTYNKLSKNEEETEESRDTRHDVLKGLLNYQRGNTDKKANLVYDLVEETGDKNYLPSIKDPYFKNGKGGEEINLTSSEYLEYQDVYADLYYTFMNESIDKNESEDKWDFTKEKAKTEARNAAIDLILKEKGIESNYTKPKTKPGEFDAYVDELYRKSKK